MSSFHILDDNTNNELRLKNQDSKIRKAVVLNYNHLVSFLYYTKIALKYMFVVFYAFKCGNITGKKYENQQLTQMSRCFSLNAMHSCTEYVLAHADVCAFAYKYSVTELSFPSLLSNTMCFCGFKRKNNLCLLYLICQMCLIN